MPHATLFWMPVVTSFWAAGIGRHVSLHASNDACIAVRSFINQPARLHLATKVELRDLESCIYIHNTYTYVHIAQSTWLDALMAGLQIHCWPLDCGVQNLSREGLGTLMLLGNCVAIAVRSIVTERSFISCVMGMLFIFRRFCWSSKGLFFGSWWNFLIFDDFHGQ